jgi:hypothetical protein
LLEDVLDPGALNRLPIHHVVTKGNAKLFCSPFSFKTLLVNRRSCNDTKLGSSGFSLLLLFLQINVTSRVASIKLSHGPIAYLRENIKPSDKSTLIFFHLRRNIKVLV